MKIKLNLSKFKNLVNSKHIIDLESPLNTLKTQCTVNCRLRIKPLNEENPYRKAEIIIEGLNIKEEIERLIRLYS